MDSKLDSPAFGVTLERFVLDFVGAGIIAFDIAKKSNCLCLPRFELWPCESFHPERKVKRGPAQNLPTKIFRFSESARLIRSWRAETSAGNLQVGNAQLVFNRLFSELLFRRLRFNASFKRLPWR